MAKNGNAPKDYEPFSGTTCERIRNIVRGLRRVETERAAAFAARDHALERVHKCGNKEKEKRTKAEADYGASQIEIDVLKKDAKFYNDQLMETVEGAEQSKLFDDAEVEPPDWDEEEAKEKKSGKKSEKPEPEMAPA